jgi:hypothetical protein
VTQDISQEVVAVQYILLLVAHQAEVQVVLEVVQQEPVVRQLTLIMLQSILVVDQGVQPC